MSTLELETYLSQQLEENPVLEMQEERSDEVADPRVEAAEENSATQELDDSFRDLWRQADGSPADLMHEKTPQRDSPARPPSLHEQLLTQLRCLGADAQLRRIAETILGWLDADGYLRNPLEEIAAALGEPVERLEQALSVIHQLEPAGVGARNLAECLLIQLTHRHQANSLAATIVRDHFDLFAKRKAQQLATKLGVSMAQIQDACRVIASLDPRPARNFTGDGDPGFLHTPDLIVRLATGEFQVELSDERLPHINLSHRYRGMLSSATVDQETKLFIRNKMRQAVWLLKAVHQRHETLLSIARCLIDFEHDYFVHGVSHLKALRQETIAQAVGCHASTVSRAIAGKTMQTPYGIIPLCAFFGGGVKNPNRNGTHLSPKTIQAEIAQLIGQEDPAEPISDQTITKALRERGFPVARRTVAKYRTALKLLPAHLRKRSF